MSPEFTIVCMETSTNQFEDALYDATKPLACTTTATEIPNHIALIERIRTHLLSIERTAHGVLIRLPQPGQHRRCPSVRDGGEAVL